MVDASGAYKKLLDGIDKKTGKFSDKEIKFTPGEIVVLKQVFDSRAKDAKNGFAVGIGESALEVKALFEGKDPK